MDDMADNKDIYKELFTEYFTEALIKPMPYFSMDSDFMRDNKIRRLACVGGWEYIGKYVAFIACLAGQKGHIYDLSDDMGWKFLLADMSAYGCDLDDDSLREFVGVLLQLELVDVEMYDEDGKLTSQRMLRNAEKYATEVAAGKARGAVARKGKTAGK